MSALLVLALFVAIAVIGMVFGADSRPRDPRFTEQQWPFFRHRS